jgi:tetratricopeptide (TPR) repeat protein
MQVDEEKKKWMSDKQEKLDVMISSYRDGDKSMAYQVANLYEEMNRYDDSIEWSRIALIDGDIDGANKLADLYERKVARKRYKLRQLCESLQYVYGSECDTYDKESDLDFLNAEAWAQYYYLHEKTSLSLYNIALFYYGNDNKQSLKWFVKLYEEADIKNWKGHAARYLGMIYEDYKAYDLAAAWFEKSVEHGNPNAFSNLSYLYEKLNNYERYIFWKVYKFQEDKDEESALDIAVLYRDKLQDYDKALEWYQKAYYTKSEVSVVAINFTMPTENELKSYIALEIAELYNDQLNDVCNAQKWRNISEGEDAGLDERCD